MSLRKLIASIGITLTIYIALGTLVLRAQVIGCSDTVVDYAQVLGDKTSSVLDAARPLANEGADVRVITISPGMMAADGTVDNVVAHIQRSCVTWQSPNHGIKSNLLVLAVAPKERKMAIMYAKDGTLAKAIAGHDDRIKKDYMGPYFKTGDWAAGLIAGEQQLTKRLTAAHDETLHPQVSTTTNVIQPTDYSGLWTVFKWLLFLTGIGLLVWVCVWLWRKVEAARQEIVTARARAVASRNNAARAIKGLIADKGPGTPAANDLDAEFSRLSNLETMNPDADDLASDQYNMIADTYDDLARRINAVRYPATVSETSKFSSGSMAEPREHAARRDYTAPTPPPNHGRRHNQSKPSIDPTPPVQSSVFVSNTIIEREPERVRESEPVRYESEQERSSGWGGSSSDVASDKKESIFGGASSAIEAATESAAETLGGETTDF